jgi:hypothetical protein
MHRIRIIHAITAMTLAAGSAAAQDKAEKKKGSPADPQAMMAAYEKASAPGEPHKLLQKMVGKWTVSMKSWRDPTEPPMESTGTAEVRSLLGDRYTQMTFSSTVMGKPFAGVAISGYDNGKKRYVGTWIDSMSTGIMRSEGTADAAGKVITSQAVSNDALTGKESRTRIVSNYQSDDKVVEEFYEKQSGKEVKTLELTYNRTR